MAFSRRKMPMPFLPKKHFTFSINCYEIFSPLSPPPSPPQLPAHDYLVGGEKQHGSGFLVAITSISAVAGGLFLGFLAALIFCAIKRFRQTSWAVSGDTAEQEEEEEERYFFDGNRGNAVDHHVWHIATVGLQRSVIDSIAVFRFKKSEGLVDGTDCSVCLNEFQEDEQLRFLPKCSHAFHMNCIDTWLSSHKNCPLCRAPIILKQNTSGSLVIEMNSIDQSSSSESGEPRREEQARVATIQAGNGSETITYKNRFVGSRPGNHNFLSRTLSDMASGHSRQARLDSVTRCYSIGSSIQKAYDTTKRPFFISAKLFTVRSSRIQDPVLPIRGSDPGSSGSSSAGPSSTDSA